ncbi:hypothetical protein ACGFYQ_38195 [Streptomyces sp. NPDC048258]|uniref:hypothetical protein n=1 Tax=Streptomyces sp. NPDC048258 TaxID=3365527 RepID=UPI00371E3A78
MAQVAAEPGPGEERLAQLYGGDGIDDLTEAEAQAWVLKVMVNYHREPIGWQAEVLVGRTGPECTGPVIVPAGGRFPQTVTAVMDQAQDLANTTRRPVRVIHGVNGKPDRFMPTLAKFAPDMTAITSPMWAAIPEPLVDAVSS